MKCAMLVILSVTSLFAGCRSNKCNEIPFWDGKSIKDFEGKTMTSMLWLLPPPYQDGVGYCLEKSRVFKRFDEADFKVLLSCLENPEIRKPVQEERLGRYLYLSFLDGTRYIIDFKDSYPFPEKSGEYTIILPNGRSKILYNLLMEKEPCPTFELDPNMDKYGRAKTPIPFAQ
ncbi:MAG TPA: hypothetical protein P5175_03675 [Anaerohalosphaeraceae bacterium]|nr:hypothetical protein [Anaerohalosphaeraceae bacterium]HPC63977.1 hypothetical protein [Anaerohalosphaeraceae bacterium]HRS70929.1 hypothetical protein [Anaerohalosphaeraceae bacterium]HRV20145.1 hypothetical protein [Anaerohalosphaeraceae bacterium]